MQERQARNKKQIVIFSFKMKRNNEMLAETTHHDSSRLLLGESTGTPGHLLGHLGAKLGANQPPGHLLGHLGAKLGAKLRANQLGRVGTSCVTWGQRWGQSWRQINWDPWVAFPRLPVLGDLSFVTCPGSSVLGDLSWVTCPGSPVLSHLSWITWPGSPVLDHMS